MSTLTRSRRLPTLALASSVLAVSTQVALPPSSASADEHPVGVHQPSNHRADVVVVGRSPGSPGVTGAVATDGGTGPAAGLCTHGGSPIPCSQGGGWWSAPRGCYLTEAGQRVPVSVGGAGTVGDAGEDATYYWCAPPGGGQGAWVAVPNGPDGIPAVVVVDPEVLARSAVESMGLRGVDIGMVPTPDDPASIGLVGLPVWLWVAEPSPATWGPVSATASAGAGSVTATARVSRVEWSMGDGAVVTCPGPGTPYADSHGDAMSPDCGHRHTRASVDRPGQAYPVTATSAWEVTWTASTGAAGTIPLQLTSTAQVRIGELQVLVQDPGA
ncbi:MAG: hypothetical protein ACFCVG_08815 [Kineosporiaceae bacterium]